jgi:hypothetical protein
VQPQLTRLRRVCRQRVILQMAQKLSTHPPLSLLQRAVSNADAAAGMRVK